MKNTTRMCVRDIYVSYPIRIFVARTNFRWKFVFRATLQACCPMHNGVEHGHACRFAPTRERHSLVRRCSSSLCVNLRLTSVTHRRKTRKPRLEHAQPCLAHATALPSPLEDERTEQDSVFSTHRCSSLRSSHVLYFFSPRSSHISVWGDPYQKPLY